MALKIFLSHAHDDQEVARAVCTLLSAALRLSPDDVTCTSDADYGLERGENLKDQIRTRLVSAQALFLLATPASRSREWVNFECGIADGARQRGEMQFYVLVPGPSYHDAVPGPHKDRLAVVLSNGSDVNAFIAQLRRTFKVEESSACSAEYVAALLDLEQCCAALERRRFEVTYVRELDEMKARHAREREEAETRHVRDQSLIRTLQGGGLAAALLVSVAVFLVGSRSGRAQAELQTKVDQQAKADGSKIAELTAQLGQLDSLANEACETELKKLPFSGFVHEAGTLRPLPCTSVQAQFQDSRTGANRRVSQRCDAGGGFTFMGDELLADPRQDLKLDVKVGPKDFTIPFLRTRAKLAVPIAGGQQ